MKKGISILLAAVLCVSIGASVFAESGAEEIDYTTGTPWMCIDLEGNVTADTPTDLKDNYALWANKDRILSMEIPEGYVAGGNTSEVHYKTTEDLKALFRGEVPEDHDSRLAYDYFNLLCDWDARDARGVEPLKEMIDVVEGITSLDALTEYFVKTPWEDRLDCLWNESNRSDTEKPGYSILSIKTGYSFIDDPAEYREMTDYGEELIEIFEAFFGKMLEKLGYSEEEAKQKFENCFAWETLVNSVLASAEERSSSEYRFAANTHYTRDELLAATPNIPIVETLEKVDGYPAMDQYLIPEPAAIERLNELYTEENLPLMRDYLILHGVFQMAEALDWESYALACDCQEMLSSGTPVERNREDYSKSDVYDDLKINIAWAVSKFYVEKHSNPEAKERISALVEEIVAACYGIIEDADFISDETRAGATAKLDNMAKHVLYPDSWEPYSCEELNFAGPQEGGTLWEAMMAIDRYNTKQMVEQINKPLDHSQWPDASTPHTYNCFYLPNFNAIYILGAYVRQLGDLSAVSDEELYAKLGVTIGHEFSHAFDPTGSQFDKEGNMNSWWTGEDGAAFSEKAERLAAFYDGIQPWKGVNCPGNIVSGEACADLAGMKVILRIAAQKEGFDYDAFFRAYADNYMSVMTPEVARQLLGDQHPLNYLRINIVLQHFDEFLNLYDIHEGDGMYLAPEDRVDIW